jgi:hypothetical protein
MVQASNTGANNREPNSEFPLLRDPALLRAAQQIYQAYYDGNSRLVQRPLGIAIHRETYRGRPIFSDKPILLPLETFVPLKEIESEMY